ncbi:P-type conjugative transfer ATPase TrbB [Escherichia coli]|uniref:P-type conjugative transfer ATPase TrbB n=1 Tax=Escherichia coli TaxID=562 RepID=UPI000BE26FD1|nr:P-type conjugative transfer ATPase TrbB [Escherichia coli]EAS9916582.1 P-type conjugative transfer ATPase TrbB [Salmonella enterica]ECA8433885.1 P-type conjugative transfer ATPase TrbB [Salmonella enterica subsp. enterica serovar Kentucky]ECW0021611.1 P-type conjugative transfer ATPase TrbB [Salmonella enterica subsp. enterica]EDC1712988.1 P-type conjugative transfer ATPase TrbB [Salmonella enterica subsp. enterica serovar Senftenberg]EEA9526855.1 P-type conjugative transfer ATPase TrbB [Sa
MDTVDSVDLRAIEKLKRDMGRSLMEALEDPETLEIMLNPDGKLWREKFGQPMFCMGTVPVQRSKTIIQTIAGFHKKIIDSNSPFLECELPIDGSRFAGQLPPLVAGPTFAIRKKASRIFLLDEYVDKGVMTRVQADFICRAIAAHKNILVIGGTGSGKTTLLNAIIAEIVRQFPDERICIIEDTGELQCAALNFVQYHTTINVTMTDILRLILRMRPDRIFVGETRGPEALDMLDAWNTGHEGGAASLHSNNTLSALTRLRSLISRNPFAPREIEPVIGEAVNVIVQISKTSEGRRIKEIREIQGYENGEYISQLIAA